VTSQVDELNSDMRQCDPHNNEKEYTAVQIDDTDIVVAVCTVRH